MPHDLKTPSGSSMNDMYKNPSKRNRPMFDTEDTADSVRKDLEDPWLNFREEPVRKDLEDPWLNFREEPVKKDLNDPWLNYMEEPEMPSFEPDSYPTNVPIGMEMNPRGNYSMEPDPPMPAEDEYSNPIPIGMGQNAQGNYSMGPGSTQDVPPPAPSSYPTSIPVGMNLNDRGNYSVGPGSTLGSEVPYYLQRPEGQEAAGAIPQEPAPSDVHPNIRAIKGPDGNITYTNTPGKYNKPGYESMTAREGMSAEGIDFQNNAMGPALSTDPWTDQTKQRKSIEDLIRNAAEGQAGYNAKMWTENGPSGFPKAIEYELAKIRAEKGKTATPPQPGGHNDQSARVEDALEILDSDTATEEAKAFARKFLARIAKVQELVPTSSGSSDPYMAAIAARMAAGALPPPE